MKHRKDSKILTFKHKRSLKNDSLFQSIYTASFKGSMSVTHKPRTSFIFNFKFLKFLIFVHEGLTLDIV